MDYPNFQNSTSPLARINVSFSDYVAKRQRNEQKHMVGGVPDYAFALDNDLRMQMLKIPGFVGICRKITATMVAREIQVYNQTAIAVGPNQFPEIYQMGVDCAQRLGIGCPNLFVENNAEMNAFTCAADDISPIIVLYSGIVERMTPAELKCVIAHECGHIHNQHTMYQTVVTKLLAETAKLPFGMILSNASLVLLKTWSRACEITADRAALICADDPEDALNVDKKLLYGATLNKTFDVDLESLRRQMEMEMQNPTKYLELIHTHPSSTRRILCEMEFLNCETYFSWRPEMKKPDSIVQSRKTTDEKCKKMVSIITTKR